MSSSVDPSSPVLAVLVTHDGAEWLEETIDALEAQHHPALEVLAVDNGSQDASRQILLDRLGPDRVLVAERDLGFGAAVSMALDAQAAGNSEYVLFLHDDLALRPDAVAELVAALERDPRLAVVGPKLVDWDDPRLLQNVGMSVDLTGRAESGLETDELDQGQRDAVHAALYVSSAGMLVRRSVFDELGRFDRRYHLFRDDLDLCWRAWLAGYDVEVVPEAVARHVAAAANYQRLGQTAFLGPRYFAERNTLATLLKNYSALRLLYILPGFFAVGVAKVLGFVATRRLADAWQTVRAWAWNGWRIRRTLRLRRAVQDRRQRTDAELRPLFVRVAPRVRAYAEAIADWVAGGEPDFDEVRTPPEAEPATATERVTAFVRRRPVAVTALVLFVLGLVAALPVLAPGSLRGGELAPWPNEPVEMLETYGSSWHETGGFGTAASPSPAQAILGVLSFLTLGSGWLASRLLLLGALPAAWVLALRAARIVTPRRLPRLAAATVYVLSPPALAALTGGQVSALIAAVALPAIVATGATVVDPRAATDSAWRATSALAIVTALLVAFVPAASLVLVAGLVITVAAVSGSDATRAARRAVVVRLLWAAAGMIVLLLPWSTRLFTAGFEPLGGALPDAAGAQPFWRWLLLAPETLGTGSLLAGTGLLAGGLLGLVYGASRRPAFVAGSWALALAGVYGAWGLGRAGVDAWSWPSTALLVTAGALAGLLALAFSTAGSELARHAFGWRQVASIATASLAAIGVGASVVYLLGQPWDAYAVEEPPLPSFIASEAEAEGPFRVLVLAVDAGTVQWDLVGPQGPSMTSYGVPPADALRELVDGAVTALVRGTDPGAAARLAVANVRFVVVPGEAGESLAAALGDQLDLEPLPVATGRMYRVAGSLPRAAFVPSDGAAEIIQGGELPLSGPIAFERIGPGQYLGRAPGPGAVFVAEAADNGWEATADGELLDADTSFGLMRFDVERQASEVTVEHARQPTRTALVVLQVFALLVAISLMLRPPGFAEGTR